MNLIFACFDLAARLGDRASDGLALKLLYGERGRDTITATRVRANGRREGEGWKEARRVPPAAHPPATPATTARHVGVTQRGCPLPTTCNECAACFSRGVA